MLQLSKPGSCRALDPLRARCRCAAAVRTDSFGRYSISYVTCLRGLLPSFIYAFLQVADLLSRNFGIFRPGVHQILVLQQSLREYTLRPLYVETLLSGQKPQNSVFSLPGMSENAMFVSEYEAEVFSSSNAVADAELHPLPR